jgi:hypothetical protein
MPELPPLRTTDRLDPALNHDCDSIHIDGYSLREVVVPSGPEGRPRKGIEIVIHGRNFRAMGQPLTALVGETPVSFLRIAPDERSVEGLLIEEPAEGSRVAVLLGDLDGAQHATPIDPGMIRRID